MATSPKVAASAGVQCTETASSILPNQTQIHISKVNIDNTLQVCHKRTNPSASGTKNTAKHLAVSPRRRVIIINPSGRTTPMAEARHALKSL